MTLDYERFLVQDYAVINPLQIPPEQYQDLQILRLLPRGLERHARMMPLLVHLSALSNFERMELADRAGRWARRNRMPLFGALLQSDAMPPVVQVHWQRVTVLRRRHPWTRMWVRLHDPRVFRHLCWILEPGQLAALMGPVAAWTWFDPLRTAWHVQNKPQADVSDPRSLELTAEQWSLLEEVEALNLCLRDIGRDPECAGLGEPRPRQLMDYLLQARKAGLQEREDRSLYARQSHRYGPQVHDRPELARRLRQAQTQQVSYFGACSDLNVQQLESASSFQG